MTPREIYQQLWAVQYSYDQHCFHVEPLNEGVNRNLHSFLRNSPTSYVPLIVLETEEDAELFKKALDCRVDRTKPITHAHIATILELVKDYYGTKAGQ